MKEITEGVPDGTPSLFSGGYMLDEVMEVLYDISKKDNEIAVIKRKMGDEPLKRKQLQVQLEDTEKNFASVRDKKKKTRKTTKFLKKR